MSQPTVVADEVAGFSNASILTIALTERVGRRGWTFRVSGNSVTGHRPEWPSQLYTLVREAEEDGPAMIGLAIDFGSMPLRGERFRDVVNGDREELFRGYGRFSVLQLTHDDTWLRPLSDTAFLHGMSDGVSRKTRLAVFDRSGEAPGSLAEHFAEASNRVVETGGFLGSELQRLYQRTVLSRPAAGADLPDVVRPSLLTISPQAEADSSGAYPWRR